MNLQASYSREEFLVFLKSFIPSFVGDFRKVDARKLRVSKEVFYLGESADLELAVFEISHTSSSEARVSLATDGFRVMKDSANYRALVAYHPADGKDWRLSLMTAVPDATEIGKVALRYSNPRRYSFFLGEGAKVNTPSRFLIKQGAVKDFDDLQMRFSLDVVNKEFYRQISESFIRLVGGTLGSGRSESKHKPLLRLPSVPELSKTSMEFGVRLIGRIIFCWFLREKRSPTGVSLMPSELLSLAAVGQHKDYYHKVLEPLFFEVLNQPAALRRGLYRDKPFSLVPYLNGGLFSASEDDFYERQGAGQSAYHNTLVVPDDWIGQLFATLETYNFTIDENTSFDEELSIDPEMLGRIFENLLAEINPETGESARKSTGSYYTPRPIVDYMVDESLLLYLKQQTKIDDEQLRAVISYELTDDGEHPLSEVEKSRVVDAIERLRLLDPACGSGAFPIGALQKMVFVLQQIDPNGQLWFRKQIQKTPPELRRRLEHAHKLQNFDYVRKLGLIRENIFGVDIQPIATEIARLRCFLTLVVEQDVEDEEDNRGIEPLPNLDFKFVTANSLIGLPDIALTTTDNATQTAMFDDREKISALRDLRDQYFGASGNAREQLKAEFIAAQQRLVGLLIEEHGFMGVAKAELTTRLTEWEPFTHKPSRWFDAQWMFGVTDGFDVVIGNPPYGLINKQQNKSESIVVPAHDLEYYKQSSEYASVASGMMNIYRLFIVKSINLLQESGIFSEIFPLAFIGDVSAAGLRRHVLENYSIDRIEAFPERDDPRKRVFEASKMSVCILLLRKIKNRNTRFSLRIHHDRFVDLQNPQAIFDFATITLLDRHNFTIPLMTEQDTEIISEICRNSTTFSQLGHCFTGEIDLTFGKKYLTDKPSHAVLLKGAILDRYLIRKVMSQGEIKYLDSGKYLAENHSNKAHHHEKRRIVMQGITGVNESIRLKLTMSHPGSFCANSANYMWFEEQAADLHLALGVLNSRLLNYIFRKFSTNSNVNGYEVDNLPYPKNIPHEIRDRIVSFVAQVLAAKRLNPLADTSTWEAEIDQLVYKLYGLADQEIKIVEGTA